MDSHAFIRHYEGVVPNIVCDWLIDSFESSDQLVVRRNGPQNFDEMNLNQFRQDAAQTMVKFLHNAYTHYCNDIKETVFFPDPALEEFRVKRYTSGTGQQFAEHVDVGSLSSARGTSLSFSISMMTSKVVRRTSSPAPGSNPSRVPSWCSPQCGCILMRVFR